MYGNPDLLVTADLLVFSDMTEKTQLLQKTEYLYKVSQRASSLSTLPIVIEIRF